jgi:hypothetical protein
MHQAILVFSGQGRLSVKTILQLLRNSSIPLINGSYRVGRQKTANTQPCLSLFTNAFYEVSRDLNAAASCCNCKAPTVNKSAPLRQLASIRVNVRNINHKLSVSACKLKTSHFEMAQENGKLDLCWLRG